MSAQPESQPAAPVGIKADPKPATASENPAFVKLAMRNMVKKGGTSLTHFALTVAGVIGSLVLLAIVFH